MYKKTRRIINSINKIDTLILRLKTESPYRRVFESDKGLVTKDKTIQNPFSEEVRGRNKKRKKFNKCYI